MTPGERKYLYRGVAAGTLIGLALGLMIALAIAVKPEFFAVSARSEHE
jgi:tetrahydromethanopterin S-methyltransferase subunit F